MCFEIDSIVKMKLSTQELKDLHKFTKFFMIKSAQIIVQSRLGYKDSRPCKPNGQGKDWFNLNIDELPEVVAHVKKHINGECITPSQPLCVEMSLCTAEKDTMVLETWCLNLLPEQCDPYMKNQPSVYTKLSVLLKSLMSVTRVIPAYKLSRRAGSDSYVIFYRIYSTKPEYHNLGEGYKTTRIGQICTPIGTMECSVAYRTKLTMSPTQTGKNNSIMVKSDHFNSNSNTRRHRNSDDVSDLTKPMRPGPFADPKPKRQVEPQLPGVERLLAMAKSKPRIVAKPVLETELSDSTNLTEEDENNKKESPSNKISMTPSRISTVSNLRSVNEEYWMKELSAPFATRGPYGELMQFYKQCRKSPPLQSPQKNPSAEEITQMIELYESQLPEYDALVQSFCESPDNN